MAVCVLQQVLYCAHVVGVKRKQKERLHEWLVTPSTLRKCLFALLSCVNVALALLPLRVVFALTWYTCTFSAHHFWQGTTALWLPLAFMLLLQPFSRLLKVPLASSRCYHRQSCLTLTGNPA